MLCFIMDLCGFAGHFGELLAFTDYDLIVLNAKRAAPPLLACRQLDRATIDPKESPQRLDQILLAFGEIAACTGIVPRDPAFVLAEVAQ
jgi:hypothetical protein